MTDWPDWPDPENNDALKRGEQPPAWPDAGDRPAGQKGKPKREPRPPREKVPPTWGRGFFDADKGKGKRSGGKGDGGRSRPAPTSPPVDKQSLKQQRSDARWAAKQQRAIAEANKRRANDARKAAAWQAAADREIAKVNQGYQKGGAAVSYDKPERGDAGESGGGCGCIFASLPGWFILLLLALLLLDILING